MLKGQKITIWTDHLNLTYTNTQYSCERILRQRLVLKEYGVEIKYIKGESNVAADLMSRLPFEEKESNRTEEIMFNPENTRVRFMSCCCRIFRQKADGRRRTTEVDKRRPPDEILYEKAVGGQILMSLRSKTRRPRLQYRG